MIKTGAELAERDRFPMPVVTASILLRIRLTWCLEIPRRSLATDFLNVTLYFAMLFQVIKQGFIADFLFVGPL